MYYLDEKYIKAWRKKPLLRAIYTDFHRRIAEHCVPGKTLEVGCGIGQFKYDVKTDILFGRCDVLADAQHLPFKSNSFDNIVMVDVLHHLQYPTFFLIEANRVLKKNGRLIMIEPAITFGSYIFYKLFHHESVNLFHYFYNPNRDNQAIATNLLRDLKPSYIEWFSFFAYPLSGGYKNWSLLPNRIGRAILWAERWLAPLGRYIAFRMLIVIDAA